MTETTSDAAEALHEWERLQTDKRVLRVREEPAFVLTTHPWKESSVIAECFTQRHGRQVLAVRGAKRPGGQFRGLINPFCPLLINYSGAGEVKNLTAAKWLGSLSPTESGSLMSAFYVNELILRFTVREEAQSALFDCYTRTLTALCEGRAVQRALREFEVDVLREAGARRIDRRLRPSRRDSRAAHGDHASYGGSPGAGCRRPRASHPGFFRAVGTCPCTKCASGRDRLLCGRQRVGRAAHADSLAAILN